MITRTSQLLARGCEVSVVVGELIVHHPSDNHYSLEWQSRYGDSLIIELSEAIQKTIYKYHSYSTGNYGGKDGNGNYTKGAQSGICLQFVNITTGEHVPAFFNACLKRSRKSKNGKVGQRLPEGRFIAPSLGSFSKFWSRTSLKTPRYPSEFYKHMGNLSQLYFEGSIDAKKRKLVNSSLLPINASCSEISRFFGGKRVVSEWEQSGKAVVSAGGKEIPASQVVSDLEPHFNHERKEYGLSNQVSTYKDSSVLPIAKKSPQEQSFDEWVAELGDDYGAGYDEAI